jgi:hypothetical protein
MTTCGEEGNGSKKPEAIAHLCLSRLEPTVCHSKATLPARRVDASIQVAATPSPAPYPIHAVIIAAIVAPAAMP